MVLFSEGGMVFPLASCSPGRSMEYEGDSGSIFMLKQTSRSIRTPCLLCYGSNVCTSSSAVDLVDSLRTDSSLAESN